MRASPEPSKLPRDEGLRDSRYNQKSSKLDPPCPRAVVDLHESRADVLVGKEDADEAVKKAADAQLEAETALDRSEKEERAANKIL